MEITCKGYADREIRLPVAAVRELIRRHRDAELVAICEREIGVSLRSFSTNATVTVATAEGDAVDLKMPDLRPDHQGLQLLFNTDLLGRVLRAFQGCNAVQLEPFAHGLSVLAKGEDWTAKAMLAGMERLKTGNNEEPREASARHHQPQAVEVERELALAGIDG